jgi:MFS family permease
MNALEVALLIGVSVSLNTILGSFTGVKSNYLLHVGLHLSASQMATFALIAGVPAYLRPFMGSWADLFPLFGLHRKSYYILSWLAFAAGQLIIGFIPTPEYTYQTIVLLTIIAGLGANLLFVIMDSIMVAVGNQTGEIGRFQSIQQGLPLVIALGFGSHLSGYVAQNWTYQQCYLAAGAVAAVGTLTALLVHEQPVDRRDQHLPNTLAERHIEKLQDKRDTADHARALGKALMSPGLWMCVVYVFYLILTPGPGQAQFVYFTTALHYSPQFIGDLGVPGNAGAILATAVFLLAGRKLPTAVYVWGAFLGDLSSYPLLFLYKGHLSAEIITFVSSATGQIYNLCLLTFAAKVTPKGVEASIYALFVSATAFAGNISNLFGSWMYDFFGPENHHSIVFGWHVCAWVGIFFTLVACVLIPFLPRWTRDPQFERETRPEPA